MQTCNVEPLKAGNSGLIEKVDYYLCHDEERKKIALAGQRKVLSMYTHEKKLKKLLEWVEEESE